MKQRKILAATRVIIAIIAVSLMSYNPAYSAVSLTPSSSSTPTAAANAASSEPLIKSIAEIELATDKMSQASFENQIKAQANAIINPKHIEEVIGNCLDQLKNIGFVVGLTAGWPNLDAILSAIINKVCDMVKSYWNQLLSKFLYSFKLPDIGINILGQNYPLFSGQIGGGFSMGSGTGGLPSATVTINTPDGTQTLKAAPGVEYD